MCLSYDCGHELDTPSVTAPLCFRPASSGGNKPGPLTLGKRISCSRRLLGKNLTQELEGRVTLGPDVKNKAK